MDSIGSKTRTEKLMHYYLIICNFPMTHNISLYLISLENSTFYKYNLEYITATNLPIPFHSPPPPKKKNYHLRRMPWCGSYTFTSLALHNCFCLWIRNLLWLPCYNLMGVHLVWTAVEFSQTEISYFENSFFIDQEVVWFHIL